jgi:putative copper resistance protein D
MSILLALSRFVHLGSLALLLGAFAFLLVVARPAFRASGESAREELTRFDRRLLRLAVWSLLTAFVSAVLWLAIQTAEMSGRAFWQALRPEIVGTVLFQTQFGRVWQLRLALGVLLAGFLLFREGERDAKDWIALRLEGALLGGGLIAALTWAGHAAATEGTLRPPHLAADVVHLLATGVWLGGLLPLALLLRSARRSLTPMWATITREATRRFSLLGLVSVASLILSGLVNSWVLVGSIAGLVGTPYGRLLLVKLALLFLATALAAINLLYLKPRLLAPVSPNPDASPKRFLRHLEFNVVGEACLGAGVLLIVGILGILPPALHTQPMWPFSFRLTWPVTEDLATVWRAPILGGLGVLLGMLALAFGSRHRQGRLWVLVLGCGLIVFAGADALRHATSVDAYPATYLGSAVPYQAASVSNGLRLYQRNCAACHGANGYGDGPAGLVLRPRPADLTAPHTGAHTAGDLFWWISHGIRGSAMPGFEDRLSEAERWDLINFLRTLSAAEQARSLGALVEPKPWLVAPDFAFGIGVGAGETLKEQRGKVMVHLVLFSLPGSLPRLEQLDAAWDTIAYAGTRIVAVPMHDVARIYQKLGMRAVNFPVAVDGGPEITGTYTLFRRTFATEGVAPIPDHMEFLIDRQGYIRARWIPEESSGWKEIPRLLREIERLNAEAPGAPAPDEHVH